MQGKTVNGYTLQKQLDTGGMAEVWLAENKIGKKAAVKLLFPQLCNDSNVVSRFLMEAKVMVDLDHPFIRQVYDHDEIEGRPCIIMEYLEGEDLKARMKHGQQFTEYELETWWNQLVDALNYTHAKGIVHRDIKPGNIFVDKNDNVKLLDFGIAKVKENFSLTQTGQKIGTLMYMSPEQVKDSKHIDYHTDIYSLAVTFIHLLTGECPYSSDSSDFEICEQIVYKTIDLGKVPSSWQQFLDPYLKKDPQERQNLKPIAQSQQQSNQWIQSKQTSSQQVEKDKTFVEVDIPSQKLQSPKVNVADISSPIKFCKRCGTLLTPAARFCKKCGIEFNVKR